MTSTVKGPAQTPGEEAILEGDPRWQVAQRAAHSPALSRATQLRAILLYIVRQTILRPDEPVHEFEIAHRALGRRSDFNPLDDSIVRVQMAHLRKRLDRYFSTDGIGEELVITIALGSYEPIFSPRAIRAQAAQAATAQEAELGKDPSPADTATDAINKEEPAPRRKWNDARSWLALAWAVTLLAAAWAGLHWRPSQDAVIKPAEISNPILSLLFAPGATVNVVVADTTLVTLQNAVHSDISIGQYLDPGYPNTILSNTQNPVLSSILRDLTDSRYTSLNDAEVAGRCFAWGAILGANTYVRYARYLHVSDFQQGNFVIIGSRRGNPWVSLFEPNLNFHFEEDPTTHTFHFRNRHPQPGESQVYNLTKESNGGTVGYVDIAILPNLAGTGTVLLLNGFSIETNQAAADLIFASNLPPALDKALVHLSKNSKVEILLRVHNLDKSEAGWNIVALRTNGA